MKKCASCSKDLPEAALHCVFCGAKQAPAPAVAPSAVAKTAFGYSANEVMQQLGNPPPQGQGYPPPQQQYQPPPQQQYQPPPQQQPPRSNSPSQQPLAPAANAQAKTMFASGPPPAMAPPQQQQNFGGPAPGGYGQPQPGYGQPQPGYGQPQPGYGQPQPGYGQPSPGYGAPAPLGIHSPQQSTPAPLPAVQQSYRPAMGSAARPIEPWKDTLKFMMFVWGGVALAAFVTPVMTDPMAFNWDAIIDAPGKAKVLPLIWAAVAVLSIAFAAIPMATMPRGALALVLGLAGILTPFAIAGGIGEWQKFIQLVGMMCLVPGLLVRHEYVESMLARVLVTIGVVCTLLPYLVPDHGQIPLVMVFKALINAGSGMEIVIIALAQIVLAVVCLMVWMPGPATAGAKYLAWAVLLLPVVAIVLTILGGRGDVGDIITKTPGMFLAAWVPALVYGVLLGYGGATVIGKQLE